MGLFDRLFRKDPGEELARAEELLAAGRAYDALVAVRRVEERAGRDGGAEAQELRRRARELEVRCREVLIASALAEADRAEAEEAYDDAADWVASAMEQSDRVDELPLEDRPPVAAGRRADLRHRREALRRRGREAARQASMIRRFEEEEERSGPDPLDTESRFGTLVGFLQEDVADLYLHRPLPFQEAYIALNDGRTEEALAAFDALAAEEPGDAVIRFERGRARAVIGDYAGARQDFEAAWEELGDEPLDLAGDLAVPRVWGDVVLELGEPAEVADRLEHLADPRTGDAGPIVMRAHALYEVGTQESRAAALALLEEADLYKDEELVKWNLVDKYLAEGDRESAVVLLERIVLPVCASAQINDLDLWSARQLVDLYLDEYEKGPVAEGERLLEVTEQILWAMSSAMDGLAEPEDRRRVERYRRAAGAEQLSFPGENDDEPEPVVS